MVSRMMSFGLIGLEAFPVTVEVDLNNGLPAFEIVGLPDAAVKESKERVRSAIKNTGKTVPTRKITANPVVKRQTISAATTSSKRAEICYFDKRYISARQGLSFNSDKPTLQLVTTTRYKNDRKHAHTAPVSTASLHKALKKKVMLASVACMTAAMIGFASGASAISAPEKINTVSQSVKSSGYSYVIYTSNEFSSIATADEAADTAEKAVTNATQNTIVINILNKYTLV